MKIHNMPIYAWKYQYIVYRSIDGDAWFYGAFDSVNEASQVAAEVHGYIEVTKNVETA